MELFQGFDTYGGHACNRIVQGTAGTATAYKKSYVRTCTSRSDLSSALEIDASVSATYGTFSFDSKSKYLHELNTTDETVTVVIYAANTEETTRSDASIPQATIDKLTTPEAVRDFVKQYGDQWVDSVRIGSEFMASFTFRSQTREEKTRVEQELKASGVFGATLNASLAMKISNAMKNVSVETVTKYEVVGLSKGTPSSNDVDGLVKFALEFMNLAPDKPKVVSFTTLPYEALLPSSVDFAAVTANRAAFVGTPARMGWSGMMIQLQDVMNTCVDIRRIYAFYANQQDPLLTSRNTQVKQDLDRLYAEVQEVRSNQSKVWDLKAPASLEYGMPSLNVTVMCPVAPNFLQGAGGGQFTDVTRDQVSQLIHLDRVRVESSSIIDMVVARYSVQYPKQSPYDLKHGDPWNQNHPALELDPDDFIVEMAGWMGYNFWGAYDVAGLVFRTAKGKYFESGPAAKVKDRWVAAPGEVMVGFTGRSGTCVDTLKPLVARFGPAKWTEVIRVPEGIERAAAFDDQPVLASSGKEQ